MLENWRLRPVYDHWYPKMTGIYAITLYPYVLFANPVAQCPDLVHKHEFQHVLQIRKEGYWFYARYLWQVTAGLWKKRRMLLRKGMTVPTFWSVYWDVTYEVEARSHETEPLTEAERLEYALPANRMIAEAR
jgi:hypothetical protein